jgi:hypothetical protein
MSNNITYKIVNFNDIDKTVELSYHSSDLLNPPESYQTIKINLDQLKNDQSVDEQLSKIAKSMVLTELEKEKTLKDIIKFFENNVGHYIPFYFVKNNETEKDIKDREPEVTFKVINFDRGNMRVTIQPYCSLFKKPEGDYPHNEFEVIDLGSSSEEVIKTYIFRTMESLILEILEEEKNLPMDDEQTTSDSLNNESNQVDIDNEEKKVTPNIDVIEIKDFNNEILSFIKNNVGVEKVADSSDKNKESFTFLN